MKLPIHEFKALKELHVYLMALRYMPFQRFFNKKVEHWCKIIDNIIKDIEVEG